MTYKHIEDMWRCRRHTRALILIALVGLIVIKFWLLRLLSYETGSHEISALNPDRSPETGSQEITLPYRDKSHEITEFVIDKSPDTSYRANATGKHHDDEVQKTQINRGKHPRPDASQGFGSNEGGVSREIELKYNTSQKSAAILGISYQAGIPREGDGNRDKSKKTEQKWGDSEDIGENPDILLENDAILGAPINRKQNTEPNKASDTCISNDSVLGQCPEACAEIRHIAFLKVPKAGSSTVQNMFYRFGVKRNLTFVLPKISNYISYYPKISNLYIVPTPEGKRYEIMSNHVMYNSEAFKRILPADSVFVGILRQPEAHMLSYLNFYHRYLLKNSKPLQEYLLDPEKFNNIPRPRRIPPSLMADYFGFNETYQLSRPDWVIPQFITQIEKDFGFIIILEMLNESLLLMKRKFCWKIPDIIYSRKMTNPNLIYTNLTDSERERYRKLAAVDRAMYEYFTKKLKLEIEHEEKEKGDFKKELEFFKIVLDVTSRFCNSSTPRVGRNDTLRVESSAWSPSFEITLSLCDQLNMKEMSFLNYIGKLQYGQEKWSKLHIQKHILH